MGCTRGLIEERLGNLRPPVPSPCSNPAKELSPLKGVGECSFYFREEGKAMEYPCKHSEVEEKRRRLKEKGTEKRGKERMKNVKKNF